MRAEEERKVQEEEERKANEYAMAEKEVKNKLKMMGKPVEKMSAIDLKVLVDKYLSDAKSCS